MDITASTSVTIVITTSARRAASAGLSATSALLSEPADRIRTTVPYNCRESGTDKVGGHRLAHTADSEHGTPLRLRHVNPRLVVLPAA
jgi:hypothetical protein